MKSKQELEKETCICFKIEMVGSLEKMSKVTFSQQSYS